MKFSLLYGFALLALSASVASADTLSFASYGSTATAPTGVSNGATTYAGGPTYNLGTGGIWTAPVGNSSWVGINPGDSPSGPNVEPAGTYLYSTSFMLGSNASSYTGTLTVMADDTTSVILNGDTLVQAAPTSPTVHCTVSTPNCIEPLTINLSGFNVGNNVLQFGVNQDFAVATGLDFAGSISTTPEPSSLLLLGSGLSTMAGLAFRRRRSA